MAISFDLPQALEQSLRAEGIDLNRDAKEAFLVDLYREGKLSVGQVADALGITTHEADDLLARHAALPGLRDEDVREEARSLDELLSG